MDDKKDGGYVSEKDVGRKESLSAYPGDPAVGDIIVHGDYLQRKLSNRQIQLIAIGGSIGTALFVSIGTGLEHAGPLSLLLAYTIYSGILACINHSIAEMTILHPVPGGFVRMAGHWVDPAFGFMAGWNFYLYEALLIPFEITALNIVLSFWSDNIPVAAICAAVIVLYAALNLLAVGAYGESEFWLSGGKVILIFMLLSFTFVTMVGGNPAHDRFGFRSWRDPGPMAEYHSSGASGRFEGFLAALWSAGFTIVGPEYVSMIAGEAKHPRRYLKQAFRSIYWRFFVFFFLGALAVGIIVPYNDPTLVGVVTGTSEGSGTAAASPYVIAMRNLKIKALPHIVNALLVTSIFSAGNTYTYAATRSLYGMAIEGRAPGIFKKTTKKGVPIWAFLLTLCFPCLSFLSVSNNSAIVLTWLTNLITAGGFIDYITMAVTYLFWHRACKAQGYDRRQLPYYGRFQPYTAWIGLVGECLILIFYGYRSVAPFDVSNFFTHYTMAFLAIVLYIGWKLWHRTSIVRPESADLVWEKEWIDQYESTCIEPPVGFWEDCAKLVGIKKRRGNSEA